MSQHLARDIASITPELLKRHGIDTILHAAYPVKPSHNPAAARRTATSSLRALLVAAHAAGVERLLHLSSATVYGAYPHNPALLTELAPLRPNPGFAYAADKAAAEEVLATFPAFPVQVVLRPSFVLGPGTANPLIRHLCRPVVLLPATQAAMQFVHRDDLVRLSLDLLGRGISGTFNVGAPGGIAPTTMARALGNRPIPLPDELLDHLNSAAWHLRHPWSPAPTAALPLLRFPWRVDCTALRRVLSESRGGTTEQPFRHTSESTFYGFADAFLAGRRRGFKPSNETQGRKEDAAVPGAR